MKFPRFSQFLSVILIAFAVFSFYATGSLLAPLLLLLLCLLSVDRRQRPGMVCDITYPADFSLPKLLDSALEGFVGALLPLSAFSLGTTNGKLLSALGTKRVIVPYISADASDVRDFNAANGDCYETGDGELDKREVTIDKRKYVSWGWNSEDENLFPGVVGTVNWAKLKGQRLAEVILADILSIVTAGNFPNSLNIGAVDAFDTDDVFDIRQEMNDLKFPTAGRKLILDDDYETALLKDWKNVNESGTTDPRFNAVIRRIAGMDEYGTQVLPVAGNLVGIANFPSAILTAIAPVEPTAAIKKKLVDFRVLTHEETGITMVYKRIADEVCDTEMQILETSYGKDVGQEEALLRLTSA